MSKNSIEKILSRRQRFLLLEDVSNTNAKLVFSLDSRSSPSGHNSNGKGRSPDTGS